MLQIPIVFATDDNYVLPLCVAIQSLKRNKNKDVILKLYILHDKLSEESKQLLMSFNSEGCKLEFINVEKYLRETNLFVSETNLTTHISQATYYRLVAPLILNQYDKLVYLDCDMLINCCLSEIYNVNLQGNVIGGVIHDGSEETKYINAGLIVFDVKKYIKDYIFEKCVDYIQKEKPEFMDQDAINYVCKDKICFYKNVYNFVSTIIYTEKSILTNNVFKEKDIKILHYLSHKKPWTHKHAPFARSWWKEVDKTPQVIRKKIKTTYKNLNKEEFNYFWYKYYFGSKLKKFFMLLKIKISLIFKKKH